MGWERAAFTMDGKQPGSDEYWTQVNRKNFVEILYTCFCDRRKFADTDVVDNNINIDHAKSVSDKNSIRVILTF